jgi:hypothetical protein
MFPVRLAFAMTVNKAQGQSLDFVGLYLPKPVFSHGQLYVAYSRARARSGLKVLATNGATRNVVYPQVKQKTKERAASLAVPVAAGDQWSSHSDALQPSDAAGRDRAERLGDVLSDRCNLPRSQVQRRKLDDEFNLAVRVNCYLDLEQRFFLPGDNDGLSLYLPVRPLCGIVHEYARSSCWALCCSLAPLAMRTPLALVKPTGIHSKIISHSAFAEMVLRIAIPKA